MITEQSMSAREALDCLQFAQDAAQCDGLMWINGRKFELGLVQQYEEPQPKPGGEVSLRHDENLNFGVLYIRVGRVHAAFPLEVK